MLQQSRKMAEWGRNVEDVKAGFAPHDLRKQDEAVLHVELESRT